MARARRSVLLATLLVLAALPTGAGAAVTWTVNGGGFGHGVGLSAYGAYGYGKHGYGYRQILHHYFRGIQITTLRQAPLVRVLLSSAGGAVDFTRATAACGKELDPTRTYEGRLSGTSLRLFSNSGLPVARCGPRLHADSDGVISIDGVGLYRGALELSSDGGGGLSVVNALNVNNYVRGSEPAEVPPEWPTATLKAFAVAIRSIALSTDVGGAAFDLYADTRTQNYGGVGDESARTDAAASATRGQAATYEGDVAQTTYFSASGGQTESGFLGAPKVPYLESVPDPYDYYSPLHRWTFRFTQAEMESRLAPFVPGRFRSIRVTQRGDSPRINYARLYGTGGSATIRGDTLAAALGLYDRWAFFTRSR
jgi:stage II sporulation protein D